MRLFAHSFPRRSTSYKPCGERLIWQHHEETLLQRKGNLITISMLIFAAIATAIIQNQRQLTNCSLFLFSNIAHLVFIHVALFISFHTKPWRIIPT